MANENETLIELLSRRALTRDQFANYLLREYGYPSLESAYKAARLAMLDEGELTSVASMNRVIKAIRADDSYQASINSITAELSAFGAAEAVYMTQLLSEFAPVNLKTPAKQKVIDYIERSIMSLDTGSSSISGVWSDLVKTNVDDASLAIINQVRTGKSRNMTGQEIIKRIETATQGVSRNAIERLVRTGTQHYAQQANLYMRDDNAEALEGGREIPHVVFDSRTSNTCKSISVKYKNGWPIGESPIGYPPYHYQCRTQIIFLPEDTDLEGTRPVISGKRGEKAEASFLRRKENGVVKFSGRKDLAFTAEQISVETDYAGFLRSQPNWFIYQTLGKTKGQAFIDGKLDLAQLTSKTLQPRTLEQLGL